MKLFLPTIVAAWLSTPAFAAAPLPSWNGTAPKQAIVAFVEKVTKEGSPDLVPAPERIATFDNDGCLWAEQPMYFQAIFIIDRIKVLAPQHPEWKTKEPFASVLRGDVKSALAGGEKALITLKAFSYRVRKYIGAYVAAMGGLDVLIFTGGIGQGSAGVRSLAVQGLGCMGIHLDEARNRAAAGADGVRRVSADGSPVTVLVVPTDEEWMIAREALRALARSYLTRVAETQQREPIPIEVSAHHIHLSAEHVEALFGPGHQLTRQSDLSQPGQFACAEQLTIVGPKGRVERVRVLGPARQATQVEIAMTEQFKLGIHPPIRESGDLAGTPGCVLEGPVGRVTLERGVICALRHIHMTPDDALRYGVRDKSTVRVRVPGDRELAFGDVRVRVDPNFRLAMHIDTDEANAANLRTGALGYMDAVQSQD